MSSSTKLIIAGLLLIWASSARAEDDLTSKQLAMLSSEAQFFQALAARLRDQLAAEHKYWQEWCEGEHTCEALPSMKLGELK